MCEIRAKYIVVSNTSLFGSEAWGIVVFQPQGTAQGPDLKGRGPDGPLIQPKSGGGYGTGLSFGTVGLGPGPLSQFRPPWSLLAALTVP